MDEKKKLKILYELTLDRAQRQKVDLNPQNFLRELGNISSRTGINKEDLAIISLEALDELVNRFKKAVREKLNI